MSHYSKNLWPEFHAPLDVLRDKHEPPHGGRDGDYAGLDEWEAWKEQRDAQLRSEQVMLEKGKSPKE